MPLSDSPIDMQPRGVLATYTTSAAAFNGFYRKIQRGPARLCVTCRGWYFAADNPFLSCCVYHAPGECCHFGQEPATPEAIALAVEAARSRYSLWTRAKAWGWNALGLIALGHSRDSHSPFYWRMKRRARALCPELYA